VKKLTERGEKAAQEAFENQLIDTVIGNMTAEIPQCMITYSIDEMVQNFEYRLQMQGLDLKTYLQYVGMDLEAFRKTFAEQAEKQVKIRLALEKIGQLENLEASEEEIESKYAELAKNYNMEVEKIKGVIPASDVKQDIISQKAIDLVRDTAVVTEAKPEPAEESTENQ
jgi:trigger factor